MAFIDIVILVVAILGAVIGLWRGLVRSIGGLAGLLLGIIACRLFGNDFSGVFIDLFPSTDKYLVTIFAYILLFVVVFVCAKLIAHLMRSLLKALSLGIFDAIGGGLFGAFKFLLVLSIILNAMCVFAPDAEILHSSTLLEGKCLVGVIKLAPYLWGLDIFPDFEF